MKKSILPTLAILIAFAVVAHGWTFTKQGTKNQKIGFGSVISTTSTGSIAISGCDGMASADGTRVVQIGTGSNSDDNSVQFFDKKVVDTDGGLGIEIYGIMQLKYIFWQEEFIEGGYKADGLQTTNTTLFSEIADYTPWLLTVVDGGGDEGEVVAIIDDGPGGILQLEPNNAALDSLNAQVNGESFEMAVGNKLWFNARWAGEDVSATTNVVGLSVSDTDVIAGFDNDHMLFQNRDGNLWFSIGQNGTPTTFDTGVNLVDETFITTAVAWDGVDTITIYVDGVAITNLTDNGTTIVFPDDLAMSPIVAAQTTSTTPFWMYVDYIGCFVER